MATIQLGRTKSASKLISYCEQRAVEVSGVNCPSEYARSQFQATRELWGKTDGIQAHHIIQSFNPGEVTPQQANEIGKDLAKEIGKGHEVTVYTHADTQHIHNHIVINSVNFENGKKYHAHGKDAIEKVREVSDRLCKEKDLSIIKEPFLGVKYHKAEFGMAKRGEISNLEELRRVIDFERQKSTTYEEFKHNITDKYGVEVKERGKEISFKHPEYKSFTRGSTLGKNYERGTIENEFANKEIRRAESQERGHTDLSSAAEKSEGTGRTDERNNQYQSGIKQGISADKGTNRTDGGLHKGTYEGRDSNPNNPRQRVAEDKGHDKLDYNKAREKARELQIGAGRSYNNLQEGEQSEHTNSTRGNEQNRQEISKGLGDNSREEQPKLDQLKGKDLGFDLEH